MPHWLGPILRWSGAAGSGLASCVALVLGGCGGGGSSAASSAVGTGPPPDPTWTSGVYQSPATFAARCAVPRTGTDPATGQPYPDKPGSADWEDNFLRAWTNAYYLWYAEVPDVNPATHAPADYFKLLKTTAVTASGNPKDKFHFTYATSVWEQRSQSSVQVGYGAVWVSLATTPPRKLLVAYTEPGTPAVAANLARGAEIVTVDGVDLVNDNTQVGVNTLNAGLSPAASGETHTFGVVDTPGAAVRTVTLTAAAITSTPVQNVKTLPGGTGLLGYFQFNDHIATAESELIAAFTQLKQAGIADLVIDLRYNGGGYLDIASEVAFMVAGPGRTTGRTFELQVFSDKYQNSTVNPVTLAALTPALFHSTAVGLSVASGTALPHLDLARVFVLTGPQTCSASEAIMNSLRGVGVDVIEIGSTTCGKPYGFYPQDNCGTTYFSIQFKGVNDAGFGDYTDGFSPANAVTPVLPALAQLPGCSVADDFTHPLGDPAEARLAAALGYLVNQQCPLPTGMAPPASPLQVDGAMAKPEWLMNRIMRSAAP